MFKITLFNENTCSFVSCVAEFFVDDIKEFELSWLNNPMVKNDQKSRYRMSKAGYLISDYYVNTEEYNIFQYDPKATILEEYIFSFDEKSFVLHNYYECESVVYANNACVKYRKILFKGHCYWIGKYRLKGACIKRDNNYWSECYNAGNKVLNIVNHSNVYRKDLTGKYRYDLGKEIFRNDVVETYCWITVAVSENEEDIAFEKEDLISDKMLDRLMSDILGEAG